MTQLCWFDQESAFMDMGCWRLCDPATLRPCDPNNIDERMLLPTSLQTRTTPLESEVLEQTVRLKSINVALVLSD